MDLFNHLIEQQYPNISIKNDLSYLNSKFKYLVYFVHEGNNHIEIFPSSAQIDLESHENSVYEHGIIFSKRKKTIVAFYIKESSIESNIEITNLYYLHNKKNRKVIVEYVTETDRLLIDCKECEITKSPEILNKEIICNITDKLSTTLDEKNKIKISNIFSKYLNKSIFESDTIETIKDINNILIKLIKETTDVVYIENLLYCRMKLYEELKLTDG